MSKRKHSSIGGTQHVSQAFRTNYQSSGELLGHSVNGHSEPVSGDTGHYGSILSHAGGIANGHTAEFDIPDSVSYNNSKSVPVIEAAPNTTRKLTACAACRKQKIKCEIPEQGPPCTRCARRKVPCIVNKSVQDLLADAHMTKLLSHDLQDVHLTLAKICRHLQLEEPKPLTSAGASKKPEFEGTIPSDNEPDDPNCEVSLPASPGLEPAPIERFLEVSKLASPGSADSPNSPSLKRPTQERDLISRGIISPTVAEKLFQRYTSRLSHFLYGIAGSYGDLQSLRQASPVLTAVVCTVAALHEPKEYSIFQACNREFRRLVAKSTFEKQDTEYIRALCIGAFWLCDASRILCSDAIRRAADSHLHRKLSQAIQQADPISAPDTTSTSENADSAVDKSRLWYLLFVCDQHLAVLYNRDSILRYDSQMVTNWELFLHREGSEEADVRIMSQVALLSIMSQGRDCLQVEQNESLPRSATAQINGFVRQLDKWFNKFSILFRPNQHIGDFPIKGLQMHYHFGRLSLCHHVLKGLHDGQIPSYFHPTAMMAHDASLSIFDMILHDEQMQEALVGVPQYFHVMIAFAGHFLLEVCSKYSQQLAIDVQNDLKLIGEVLALFTNLECIPQHPIRSMTIGLGRKLLDCSTELSSSAAEQHVVPYNDQQRGEYQHMSHQASQPPPEMIMPFSMSPIFSNEHYSELTDPNLLSFANFQFTNMHTSM